MFDFSPAGIVMAFVMSLWASLPSVGLVTMVAAFVLLLVRHRLRSVGLRAAILGLAAALGLFGLLWQGAATSGALKMQARDHALALRAERERADKAEAITRGLAERATQDLADAQADNLKLKDMLDALSKDPRGSHPAVPRDLARGLRNL